VQLPFTGIVPLPLRTIDVEVEEETDPPLQVVATPVWVMPESVSLTATLVRAAALPEGLAIVRVRVEVPPGKVMLGGANALLIVGGDMKFNVAEPVEPVPPLVELTVPVVLR